MFVPLPADDELLPRLKSGDEAAFVELLSAWTPSLRRLARNFVKSDALADEVVQETWMGVIKGIGRFEGRSSLKTWVFTILANRARTRGTREARTVPLSALGDRERNGAVDPDRFLASGAWGEPPFSWRAQSAESVVRARESVAVLEVALSNLPVRQRRVVELRDIEGIDASDVCNLLEITESNQRVLLHRGRSKLRAALEDHYRGADQESERSRAVAH